MLADTFIPKPDLASTTNLFAANWAALDTAGAFEQAMRAHQHGTISDVAKPSTP